MMIGYARVSTDGQTLSAQTDALTVAGCERIFSETASGAKTNRAALAKALAALQADDVLVVTRLDRLARSTLDLLTTVAAIGTKRAHMRSLADTWADTTTPHGRLMLTVLGGLAEFERSLIIARTGEGRRRAMARGVKMGPKFVLTPHQVQEASGRLAEGESRRDIARSFNVSHQTIGRLAQRLSERNRPATGEQPVQGD